MTVNQQKSLQTKAKQIVIPKYNWKLVFFYSQMQQAAKEMPWLKPNQFIEDL